MVIVLLVALMGSALGQESSRIRYMGFKSPDEGGAAPLEAPGDDQKFPRVIRFKDSSGKATPRQMSQTEFSPFVEVSGGKLELDFFRATDSDDSPWVTVRLPRTGDYLICFVRNEKGGEPTWKNPQVFVFEALKGDGSDETSHFLNASQFKILFRRGRARTEGFESGMKAKLDLPKADEDILMGLRGADEKPRVAFQGKAGEVREGTRRYFMALGDDEDKVKILQLEEWRGRLRVLKTLGAE